MEILLYIFIGFVLLVFLGAGTSDRWEGRIKKPFAIVILVTLATWVFWWISDDPMEGVVLTALSPVILAGCAIIIRLVAKKAQRWFWLGVFTFLMASFALIPITGLLEKIPSWAGSNMKVVLEVETPDGRITASGDCYVREKLLGVLDSRRCEYSVSMESFTLDLGEARVMTVSLAADESTVILSCRGEITDKVDELLVKMPIIFTGTNGSETQQLDPWHFDDFFGLGVRYRKMWVVPME